MKHLLWRIAVVEVLVDVVPLDQVSVGKAIKAQVSAGQAIKAQGREVPVSVVKGLEDQKTVVLRGLESVSVVQRAVAQKGKDLKSKRRAPEAPDLGDLDLRDRKVERINLGLAHVPVSNQSSVVEGSEVLVGVVARDAVASI